MKLLLAVSALLGVWSQDIPQTSQQIGGANVSFVVTTVDGVADVTATFSRPTTQFQWVGLGFSGGTMSSGSDMFLCEPDGTVGRYWTTTQAISAAGKVTVPNANCTTATAGAIRTKTMKFQRLANTTATTQRAIAATTAVLLAYGDNPLAYHGANRASVAVNVVLPPSPGGMPVAPTPANRATALGGQVEIIWNFVGTDSIHFTFSTPNTNQYVALGFQTSQEPKMTGDAVVVQGGGTPSIAAYTVTFGATPSATAGTYFTNGTAYVSGGILYGEFTRTFAAPLAGSVPLSDQNTDTYVMVAYGNNFPAVHINRASLIINLQSGGTISLERRPEAVPKIVAIVILGICALVGFIFTVGLSHTKWGRFLFFRRVCKDSQFLGSMTPGCFDFTWGQVLLLTTYFCLIILFSRLEFGEATQPRFVRAMGWTSTLSIAFASLPVSRHSVYLYFFGMSFERAITIHRVLGRFAVCIVLIHFIAVLAEPQYTPFDLTLPAIPPYNINVALGFFALMCLLVMLVTSMPVIRRKFFEVFYATHHLFIVVWILAILHNSSPVHQITLIVPLVLWLVDRFIRIFRGRIRKRELVSATVVEGVLRLEFKGDINTFGTAESGSYAFINVPAVSWFQWHPFSISSRAGATNFTFHIKNMGFGTYTAALHEYFAKNPSGAKVNIDGPYGRSAVRFEEYHSILLIAGGIGVTPMIAILDDLYEKAKASRKPALLQQVTFCWAVQSKESISWMEDVIKKIQANPTPVTGVTFDVQIFVTRGKEDSPMYKVGRPKYQGVFEGVHPKQANSDWRVGVLACGPEQMVVECQKQSMEVGYDFHKEIFAF